MRPAILTLLFAAQAPAAPAAPPTLAVPAEIRPVGEYAQWTPGADTAAKAVSYVPLSGVEPFPPQLLRDQRAFVLPVRGLAAGRYKFRAVGSLNDEHAQAEFVVVIGDAPAPGPGPNPPAPSDPLRQRLKAAYDADPSPQKAEARATLAELYRQAAALAADPAVRTAGDLLGRVKKAAEALAPGALVGVRKVVAEELAKVLPTDAGEDLTAAHRAAAAGLFGKLAAALDSFGG